MHKSTREKMGGGGGGGGGGGLMLFMHDYKLLVTVGVDSKVFVKI